MRRIRRWRWVITSRGGRCMWWGTCLSRMRGILFLNLSKRDHSNGSRTVTGRAYCHPTCKCQLTSNKPSPKPSNLNPNNNNNNYNYNIYSPRRSVSSSSSRAIYSNWCKGFIISSFRIRLFKIYTLPISKKRINTFRLCGMCILGTISRKIR